MCFTNKQTTGTQFICSWAYSNQATGLIVFVVCNATHILHNVHCLSGQLFGFSCAAYNHSGNNIDYHFSRFLEVFVPLSILSKSNRNNLFVVLFACSIAFQRYKTWYGNNYLNLINCHAGQKKGEVLVRLDRATPRDKNIKKLKTQYTLNMAFLMRVHF